MQLAEFSILNRETVITPSLAKTSWSQKTKQANETSGPNHLMVKERYGVNQDSIGLNMAVKV